MKNKKQNKFQQGFTLVELLVVIGILGILAAALLAVIDPIEQLNKASDQTKKGVAVEYVGAMQRYYATKQVYPMAADTDGGIASCGDDDSVDQSLTAALISDTGVENCTDGLIASGELKTSFKSSNVLDEVYVAKEAGVNEPVMSCFQPVSKSYKKDALTKFTDETGTDDSCDNTADACYWCAQ